MHRSGGQTLGPRRKRHLGGTGWDQGQKGQESLCSLVQGNSNGVEAVSKPEWKNNGSQGSGKAKNRGDQGPGMKYCWSY